MIKLGPSNHIVDVQGIRDGHAHDDVLWRHDDDVHADEGRLIAFAGTIDEGLASRRPFCFQPAVSA